MTTKTEYLNNKILYATVVKNLANKKTVSYGEKTVPKLSEELATMFMTLVNRYGRSPQFKNYTFNDDMQSAALLTLCRYWHAYNPDKYRNAFAYYTQVIKNSFIQYIQREKKHFDLRDELLLKSGLKASLNYMEKDKNSSEQS